MVRHLEPVSARPGGGPTGSGPVRTCVGCRTRAADAELLRVVLVDGDAIPDPRRRMPGRGAWLHPDPGCLAKAEKRRAFPRAFKVQGPVCVEGLRSLVERAAGDVGTGSSRAVEKDRKQVDPS
ncbi:YlxR family protein [Actinokineospora auranticolor]|uniref:YlxR family protein n=1 Tax=Actinokineospora auranticolor TaxID=155976 RepID=UPI000CEC7295|nr:YlxR family protein [Actinokineospora auranticolor]